MEVVSTGTVPETSRTGIGAIDADPPPGADRPTAEEPSTEELAQMARDAAPHGGMPTDALTTARLQGQTNTVVEHLGAYYADPNAAHDKLHALSPKEREALLAGDASVLGELRDDAPTSGLRTDALVAHHDVYEQNPEAAARVTESRNALLAAEHEGAVSPQTDRPERASGMERGGPDDPAGDLEPPGGKNTQMPGLTESMEHRVIAHAMSPHQI